MVRKQTSFFSTVSVQTLIRIIVGGFFVSAAALNWDIWWHAAVGTGIFLTPPHLFLIGGVMVIFFCAILGALKTKDSLWKHLACVSSLILIAAPFDQIHHSFSQGGLAISAATFWSPLHLLVFGGLLGGVFLFLPFLEKERDVTARYVLSAVLWGVILDLAFTLMIPFFPLGTYGIIGFWGSGVTTLILVFLLLHAQQTVSRFGAATLATFVFLILHAMSAQIVPVPGLEVPSYANIPNWLLVAAFIATGFLADISTRFKSWFRGLLMGLVFSATLYTFASCFIGPEFRYHMNEALAAIITSLAGGILAGILVELHREKPKA